MTTNVAPFISMAPKGPSLPDDIGYEIFDDFKDTRGRYRTQSLFVEKRVEGYNAYFNLKKVDKAGYVSMYKRYMEIADPTEYQVAIRLLGSWDHWQVLCKAKWFLDYLTGWREELKVKLESDRYYEMLERTNDPKTKVSATKWLATRYGEEKKEVLKRGRPSNSEKAKHLKQLQEEESDLNDDAARIGLK